MENAYPIRQIYKGQFKFFFSRRHLPTKLVKCANKNYRHEYFAKYQEDYQKNAQFNADKILVEKL